MLTYSRIIYIRNSVFVRYKSTKGTSSEAYCVNLVKNHDYENFLCTLALSPKQRKASFAIRAFNIEIANVGVQAKEPHIGRMRLKFWEDSIDNIFSDKPPQHPVAVELHQAIEKTPLSKKHLRQLVVARADNLTSRSFMNIDQLEKYAENSISPVFYLQLINQGIQNVEADHAMSHLGKCLGITNMVRSVPYHAQRRTIVLPQDLLVQNKVSDEAIFRGASDKSLRDVVFSVATRANTHLRKAKEMRETCPDSVRNIFLYSLPTAIYLRKLQEFDFDVFHPSLNRRNGMLPIKIWLASKLLNFRLYAFEKTYEDK